VKKFHVTYDDSVEDNFDMMDLKQGVKLYKSTVNREFTDQPRRRSKSKGKKRK